MHEQMVSWKAMIAVLLLPASVLAAAAAHAAELKGVLGAGFDFGGETLATVVDSAGTRADIKANNGMVFHAGAVLIVDQYETQITAGYKFGGPFARNGSATWDTVPLEFIQFLRAGDARIGLGFSYHINPRLVVDMPGASYSVNYEDALGTNALIGWAPAQMNIGIDLRYTSIRYKQSNVANARESSGNVLGIYASVYF